MYTQLIALHRFGLGARIDQAKPEDPVQWLQSQLYKRQSLSSSLSKYPSIKQLIKQRRQADTKAKRKEFKKQLKKQHKREVIDRVLHACQTETPFQERLIWFLSNVLTVSNERPQCTGLVGSFEREVVRKHLHDGYAKMLIASTQHPAMLLYLDNVNSVGPDSKRGRKRKKGRNENLAREILELHTVGLAAKYTQKDVIALANILTGWTIPKKQATTSGFYFNPNTHQPGPQKLLRKSYTQQDVKQGEAALTDLAKHPLTAHHLATRMAKHFISDAPSDELINSMAKAYLKEGTSLTAMANAMVLSPESWEAESKKLKTPIELIVSSIRLLVPKVEAISTKTQNRLYKQCQILGHLPYNAPSPKGWSDNSSDWLGGESLLRRLKWAQLIGKTYGKTIENPAKMATKHLILSEKSRLGIARAPDRETAVALLIASPEFQKR